MLTSIAKCTTTATLAIQSPAFACAVPRNSGHARTTAAAMYSAAATSEGRVTDMAAVWHSAPARRTPLLYFAARNCFVIAMFESLSSRVSTTIERLRGRARLTEANIRESLREVRIALLEADVALPVVQALIQRIQVRAVGQEVLKSLTPGQSLVKVVRDELTAVMGTANTDPNLAAAPPAVVLMAGLQGAGKTTTVAKLARFLKERRKKKVMVVSADVYRPAAIEQLRLLAEQVDVLFHRSSSDQDPVAIAKAALD